MFQVEQANESVKKVQDKIANIHSSIAENLSNLEFNEPLLKQLQQVVIIEWEGWSG